MYNIFAFANPVLSGALLASTLSLFLAHVILRIPLPAVLSHIFSLVLLVSAALHLHNRLQPGGALPPLRLPTNPHAVLALAGRAGDRVNAAVAHANVLLSWSDPLASARALSYAWLAARAPFVFSPTSILLLLLLCFALGAGHSHWHVAVDGAIAASVQPLLHDADTLLTAVEARVAGIPEASRGTVYAVVGAVGLLCAYTLWPLLSFSGVATTTAVVLVGVQLVHVGGRGSQVAVGKAE